MVKVWIDRGINVQSDCPSVLIDAGFSWHTAAEVEIFKRHERRRRYGWWVMLLRSRLGLPTAFTPIAAHLAAGWYFNVLPLFEFWFASLIPLMLIQPVLTLRREETDIYAEYQDRENPENGYRYWDPLLRERVKRPFPKEVLEIIKRFRALPGQEDGYWHDSIWTVGGGACLTLVYCDQGWLYYFPMAMWNKDGQVLQRR